MSFVIYDLVNVIEKKMKHIAVIFAGGIGKRMNTVFRPKQFLELNGKPVIIYTLEVFDNHPMIDGIVVVCIEEWIPFLQKQLKKFEINKVIKIVRGGKTGQDSIFNGIDAVWNLYENKDVDTLIHDGVRPLITEKTITDCIEMVEKEGNCITCIPATETFVVRRTDGTLDIPTRDNSLIARAPQCFRLKDIYITHKKAQSEGKHDFIDSCTMMSYYGHHMHTIIGPMENIKITTPTDFFIFRAMTQVHENQQIFGY